ncbi:hypothetical protein ACFQL7_27045 [Halocatena marina]|uniref:Transposase n=1 Tax=Halocatena marina TaxID=2934937 RepID=A0ABD5YUR0_9EURY
MLDHRAAGVRGARRSRRRRHATTSTACISHAERLLVAHRADLTPQHMDEDGFLSRLGALLRLIRPYVT